VLKKGIGSLVDVGPIVISMEKQQILNIVEYIELGRA